LRSRNSKKGAVKESQPGTGALWFTRDLLGKAFALGGCAICHAVHASECKGIHSFLHEGMMFPLVRQKFLDGGGFCPRHFWMAKEIEEITWQTGGFGLAILCEELTRLADRALDDLASSESKTRPTILKQRAMTKSFLPGHDCMFCQDNREKERFLTEALEELVDEEEFQMPLAEYGLCIRHGQLAVETWKPSSQRHQLSVRLKAQIAELSADLREFIRKRDYQHRNETPGRERDSVFRAMRFFVRPNPCNRAGATVAGVKESS
jgi:Family of unknown function (DUF6062)